MHKTWEPPTCPMCQALIKGGRDAFAHPPDSLENDPELVGLLDNISDAYERLPHWAVHFVEGLHQENVLPSCILTAIVVCCFAGLVASCLLLAYWMLTGRA